MKTVLPNNRLPVPKAFYWKKRPSRTPVTVKKSGPGFNASRTG